jgi:pimeloyl-ACP methyl ester carboxylesterase
MTFSITKGGGLPIALIAQLGCGGDIWKPVVDQLTGLQVITYDRPGTGNAPPRPAPNPPVPPSRFADELADLLAVRRITGPAVIVGHSFGGLVARQYAARQPERTAGLVLLDCSIPPMHLHPDTRRIIDGDEPDGTEVDTVRGHAETLEAVLPAVPALVVSRTHGRWDGVNPPPHPAVEDVWRAWQRRYAADLGCPLLVADNSGHQLQREATALVAYAIRAVHEAARDGGNPHVDETAVEAIGGKVNR